MSARKPSNSRVLLVKRPVMRYHGGKWMLAPWIISHFPAHRIYVEPFGGAASVLLRKKRSYAEVYNDLDGEVLNLFRVLRERGEELQQALTLTLFHREEYYEAWNASPDTLEQARRTLVRSFMGFGSASVTESRAPADTSRGGRRMTGFRSNAHRNGNTPAADWKNYADLLPAVIDRLRGVTYENRDALEVIGQHDSERTLFYLDPPYVKAARDEGSDYRYEMTDDQHRELAALVHGLKGMVILSGYDCPLYQELFGHWRQTRMETHADGGRDRTEVLWFSANCPVMVERRETPALPEIESEVAS